jgi:hypothetical protein
MTLQLVSGVSLALAVFSGCASEATPTASTKSVVGNASLLDHVSSALTTANVMAIKGTYGAGCTSRTGNWAIGLNGYVFIAGETQLSVVAADTTCVLSVTEVKAGAVLTPVVYKPATDTALTANFATSGVAFTTTGLTGTQFYANFRIQPDLAFNTDFIVQMVYSDNVSETDLATNSNFSVVVATATAALVPASNATMTLTDLVIKVDAKNVVKTATGKISVAQGTIVAESYVVDLDGLGASPTYATIDTMYNSPGKTRVPMTGTSTTIVAADLNLVGLDLTSAKKRNVIVANIVNGVNSYQLFQIVVNHP